MNPGPRTADDTTRPAPAGRPPAAHPFLSPPERPDEIGRLGAFRVLAELGKGGMGVVFRAEEVGLSRQVALKVMLPSAAASPGAVARFEREAKAQAAVEHDHIIPIHRVDEANGVTFLAMPLLKGQTLAAALKQNRHPPVAEVVRIGAEMADGLAAAHDAGLIHRDIKPANVWLEGGRRRVKILDFGLARVAHEPPAEVEPTAAADGGPAATADGGTFQTAAGAVMGTPAYMAPEQARGLPTDSRTDLFSLGVVLYEMATGRKPFTGPSSMDVMAAVVSLHPQPPHELNPDVPPALSELIRRLMAKDPAHRPAAAEAVAEELEAVGRGLAPLPVVMPVGDVPGGPNPWADIADTEAVPAAASDQAAAPPTRGRKPLVLAAGAVLAAAAVVALVVAAMNRPKRPREADPPSVAMAGPKKDVPTPKDVPGGTIPSAFFNGKDLTGWSTSGQNVWRVDNGAIVGQGVLTAGAGPRRAFGDFELSFRAAFPKPRKGAGLVLFWRVPAAGYAQQLHLQPEGAYLKFGGKQSGPAPAKGEGADQVTVRCVGKRVTVTANGVVLTDEEDWGVASEGTIKFHGSPELRDVTISDIRFTDLSPPAGGAFFNGRDLTGWAGVGTKRWKVVDGALVSDAPGAALHSERTFGDFELSVRVKLSTPHQGWLSLGVRHGDGKDDGALRIDDSGVRFTGLKGSGPIRPGEFNEVTSGAWAGA